LSAGEFQLSAGAFSWAVGHAYRRKIRNPLRLRQWRQRQRPFVHRTNNLMFRLYPGEFIDRHIYVEGIYEQRFLDFVRPYYRQHPGRVALDVGANIGNHALYLSDCFSQIHCFDPNPVAVERLEENMRLSRVENLFVHPVGLSNDSGELPFVINDDGNLGVSHFASDSETGPPLPIVVGDEFVHRLGLNETVDFIKVDVENHEPEVFEGLRETIKKHRPMVAFEYHGHLVPEDHFARIASVLGGYILAETVYSAPNDPTLKRLARQLRDRDRPTLAVFSQPERRTYENILAFPDMATLERFSRTQ
jgi:FkbM family methyltransferase